MSEERSKVRIQLDLSPAEAEALERLRAQCNLRSKADTVKVALSIVEWINNEVESGRQVVGVGQGYVSNLLIPGVTSVRRKAKEVKSGNS